MMVSLNATYSNTSSSHVVASLQAAVAFATTPLMSDSDSSLDAYVHKLDMMEKDFTDTKYSISLLQRSRGDFISSSQYQ